MKYLFVVGHPAHVHLFRNSIRELVGRGHKVVIAAIEKESTSRLLQLYGLDYVSMGGNAPSIVGKIISLPAKNWRFFRLLAAIRPDLVVSTGSPYAAQASAALSIPHVAFSDTEIASGILRIGMPFTDAVCTPSCFWLDLGPKHVRYKGYHELAYLHPARFSPNADVLDLVNAKRGTRLIIVRFASWDSSHDMGVQGLNLASDKELVEFLDQLKSLGRVLVTSERPLPKEASNDVLRLPIHRIHDLLSFSALYIGEGATMASEAGVLGTPWIFVSTRGRGYLDDQERTYGLGYRETTAETALARARSILADSDVVARWAEKRERLLRDKIDVTSYIVSFVENWPSSFLAENSSSAGGD